MIVAEKFFNSYRGLFRNCSGGGGGCLEDQSSFVNSLSPISKGNFGTLGPGGRAMKPKCPWISVIEAEKFCFRKCLFFVRKLVLH